MTDKTDTAISGEERLRSRRNKLILFVTIGCAAAMLLGFSTGYVGALYEDGTISGGVVVGLWAMGVLGFVWFNFAYFRRIDELDRQDNFIAAVVSFCFYVIAYPSYHMFRELGLIGEISWQTLYIVTLALGCIVYFARKLNFR